jgi:hypothetical protein
VRPWVLPVRPGLMIVRCSGGGCCYVSAGGPVRHCVGLPETLTVRTASRLRSAAAAAGVDLAWLETPLDAEFSAIGQRRADAGLGWLTPAGEAVPAALEVMSLGDSAPPGPTRCSPRRCNGPTSPAQPRPARRSPRPSGPSAPGAARPGSRRPTAKTPRPPSPGAAGLGRKSPASSATPGPGSYTPPRPVRARSPPPARRPEPSARPVPPRKDRPRRRRNGDTPVMKAKGRRPSPAALGVVRVDADFQDEYPGGDTTCTEAYATLIRTGQALLGELDRRIRPTFDMPQATATALTSGTSCPPSPRTSAPSCWTCWPRCSPGPPTSPARTPNRSPAPASGPPGSRLQQTPEAPRPDRPA